MSSEDSALCGMTACFFHLSADKNPRGAVLLSCSEEEGWGSRRRSSSFAGECSPCYNVQSKKDIDTAASTQTNNMSMKCTKRAPNSQK